KHLPLNIILTSPLLRARQTADGMAKGLPSPAPEVRVCDELAPGGKRRRLARVIKELGLESVAVVGHQPDLGIFVAWLIGSKNAEIDMAKAGVALVTSGQGAGRIKGSLAWMLTPE